jgi:hypothetical protein
MEQWLLRLIDSLTTLLNAKEFWSAIAGAVVGGSIAYAVQVRALKEGRAQRREDRDNARSALAHSILFKVIKIHSNLYGFDKHFKECFGDAAARRDKLEPWQFMRPVANPPDSVHFTPDEMAMVLALKHDNIFNDLLYMDSHYNGLIGGMALLDAKRTALTEQVIVLGGEGPAFNVGITKDKLAALVPKIFEVNRLATDLRGAIAEATQSSNATMTQLNDLLRERLGLSYKIDSQAAKAKPGSPTP